MFQQNESLKEFVCAMCNFVSLLFSRNLGVGRATHKIYEIYS